MTRYLTRAFAFDDAFLLLLDRENARLTGTWTHRSGDHGLGHRVHSLAEPIGGVGVDGTRLTLFQRQG